MTKLVHLLRMLIVAAIVMIGAGSPATACAGMALGAEMAAGMAMADPVPDHGAPPASPGCDMACLACLVQPASARLPAVAGWTTAAAPAVLVRRLHGLAAPPELPPPRFRPAPSVQFL